MRKLFSAIAVAYIFVLINACVPTRQFQELKG